LQAIVEGEPPDLPTEGFSATARDFVKGCLNKRPNQRPTYAMLLNHAWIQPFSQPETIAEEAEEGEEAEAAAAAVGRLQLGLHEDDVVAAWVKAALARNQGGPSAKATKPALHKVALIAGGIPMVA
jgi:mitogen-activated protein kinase kinase